MYLNDLIGIDKYTIKKQLIAMAELRTHLLLVESILKELNINLNILDTEYLKSGSVIPDICLFLPRKALENKSEDFSAFWHGHGMNLKCPDEFGLEFGYNLLKHSKTRKDKLFSIGFISHFFLDVQIHIYFREYNLSIEDHLSCEYYLDAEFKMPEVTVIYFPKALILKTLKQDYPEYYKRNYNGITNIKLKDLWMFKLSSFLLKQLIIVKYKKESRSWFYNLIELLIKAGIRKYNKKHNSKLKTNIDKIINPDPSLRTRHMKNLKERYYKARKEFKRFLKKEYSKF